MVQFTTGASAYVDFTDLDLSLLLDGDIASRSSSRLVVDVDVGDHVTFTGFGFTYDSFGDPVGGTITGISETIFGQTLFQITGMNTQVGQFVDWVVRGADFEAIDTILAGNDSITGGASDDILIGFAGHDNLSGGLGADTLVGGDGNDHIWGDNLTSPNPNDGDDVILGGAGSDYVQGNAGNDAIDGEDGSDRLVGGKGNDLLLGSNGNDTINGNLGADHIDGGADNDSLRGGQGNDELFGGNGNDILSGDLGTDTLTGGNGSDLFVVSGQGSMVSAGPDRIADFVDGADRISVGYTPAIVLTGAVQSSLTAAAAAAQQLFDARGGNGEVAALAVGSDTYLFYSSNGGASADSAVLVANVGSSVFTIADFG
ncbi:calcium-binding protein [Rhizorhabdus argentea]|uniref:calcium-binding protein n=1 Tax=Rhizorhabdus argentea TaxID=1387174 RepID=UPI0030EEC646